MLAFFVFKTSTHLKLGAYLTASRLTYKLSVPTNKPQQIAFKPEVTL